MPKRYRSSRGSKGSRRSSSWRIFQRHSKFRKSIRKLGLALLVVLGVLLVNGAYKFIKLFVSPLDSAAGSYFQNSSSWDGEMPLSLLYLEVSDIEAASPRTRSLGILSFNPTQGLFTTIGIPVSYGKLEELYGLGEINAAEGGVGVVAQEVQRLLGIPIDGYLVIDEAGRQELANLFPDVSGVKEALVLPTLFKLPQVWLVSQSSAKISLDITGIARAAWYLLGVRADRITDLVLTPDLLDDPAGLDRRLSSYFRDDRLAAEHLKIQVLNGSVRGGVAATAARMVRNMGGDVIRVDNFERQDLVKGYLLMETGSYTASRLARVFGVSDSRPPREGEESRANITLILGSEN
ncbi:MAG: LCP family protein [Patescibacteria group bacterium]